MKIVYLAAYFYPEKYASDEIYSSILEELAKSNEVHVIAPQPTRGVSDEEFEKYHSYEVKNGVIIHRFPMVREQRSALKRMLRYKRCERKYRKILKAIGHADYIFVASTPPTMGLLAGKLAKKIGAKFIYSLQDIFPDSLISSGILRKKRGPIWWIGKRIEQKTYNFANRITVISDSFYKNLRSKNVPIKKLALIPNWVDLENVYPVPKEENFLFEELGIKRDRFNIVYAGNMGAAQGVEIILDLAEQLKDAENVQFVVFGGGTGYEDFVCAVKERKLHNVIVNPLLTKERVSEVYSLGDVALIICKKGVGQTGLPSKTWSIMACNTPIVASFDTDSELAEILQTASAGICIETGDVTALSATILGMMKKPLTVSSRQYLRETLSKEVLIGKYLELFNA